ncbi:MAG: hypothetical protein ACRD0O_02930 [Acidimicrobiia bacterium]
MEANRDPSAAVRAEPEDEEEGGPIPFHLKALGGALVIYLGYRFVQGIEWVVHRL